MQHIIKQHLVFLTAFTCLLQAGGKEDTGEIDTSQPLVRGWLDVASGVDTVIAGTDSIMIDTEHPSYRYPGRAMLMSFLVPGLGNIYIRKPLKALLFVAVDAAAYYVWQDYTAQGDAQVALYRAFADSTWDFKRWYDNAPNFQGTGWENVNIGIYGTHELDYVVADMDGDGRVEYSGTTGDSDRRFAAFMTSKDTSAFVQVRKTGEYYENIGKYNQFFSGWSDANPFEADVVDTKSGYVAWSPSRRIYVGYRGEANRLKSIAGYAISSALFSHVVGAVDALFGTSAWNREHAVVVSGSLIRSAGTGYGVRGVELSLLW